MLSRKNGSYNDLRDVSHSFLITNAFLALLLGHFSEKSALRYMQNYPIFLADASFFNALHFCSNC
jgi:hypothetical protein